MLLAVVLTLMVAGCSYSNSQECAQGLYYDSISDGCVSECPCGSFGNSVTQQCKIDVYYYYLGYYGEAGFNQTEYKFSVPMDAPPGTRVGTAWISMPLSIITLEDGTLAPFQLNGISIYFNGLLVNFDGTLWTTSPEYFYLEVYFANKHQDVVEGSGSGSGYANILNLTLDDVNYCGKEHILIPIDIYTQSKIFGIGTYLFGVSVSFIINNNYNYLYTKLSVDVTSDCDSDEYYLFSTGQCVSECPCGTATYPGFCYEESGALILGIPQVEFLDIDPRTPQGAKIHSYNMFLNITNGSALMNFDGNDTISLSFYYQLTYHREDPGNPRDWDYIYHYYVPEFGIKLPGMDISAFIDLTGPIEELFPVSNTEIEQCSWGGSTFIKVPVEIYLLSPYLYHLGVSFIIYDIYVPVYGHPPHLYKWLAIEANADCPSHLHYDFDSGSCVSKCPCGLIGFDYHTPHYCEPVPDFANWHGYSKLDGEYNRFARFSETNYLLELPWDNPPKVETFKQSVFVYPDLADFLEYKSPENDTIVLAHVEVLYIGSNYTTGQGYGVDTPMVTITGPTLPDSENGTSLNTTGDRLDFILKNSSQYGLEYCYDDLQDRVVGYIPITVTVISLKQYSLLANHSFSLFMSFSSPNDIFLNYELQYAYDTFNLTISITPGETGAPPPVQEVTPPNVEANRLQVVIDGLVPGTFTPERKQSFKEVTAELVTEYCSVNDCTQIYINSKKRRQAVMVEPKHVALQSISEDSEGRLVFYMYIQLEQGILAVEIVQNALQGSEELYINRVDGITAMVFVELSTSSTTSPSPTTPTMEVETPTVIITIVVLATVVLVIIVAVVVCAAVSFAYHKRKHYSGKESAGVGVFPLEQTEDDDEKPLATKDDPLAEKVDIY